MNASVIEDVNERDLIEPSVLKSLVAEVISDGIFAIEGSLHDYTIHEFARLMTINGSAGGVKYKLEFGWGNELDEESRAKEEGRVRSSFLRAGVVTHSNVSHVMEKLREHDDVIVGVDTNVLWDCVISSHLLDKIYEEPYPNWVLVAIPKLVMAETENAANQKIGGKEHPRIGWPGYRGRRGQRALQEIMDLREKDPGRPGIAVMTVGDLAEEQASVDRRNWQLDSDIRTQFREFLIDISFHKGTYFLSQDRVNVMMADTEGADGLYLQKPDIEDFKDGRLPLDSLVQLLYELCVQFGEIRIEAVSGGDLSITLRVFWPGKHVSDWKRSRLMLQDVPDR